MSNLTSLEFLLIKQTCRFFAHKFELPPNSNQPPEDPTDIYSCEFLKALHDRPKEIINRVISSVGECQTDRDVPKENENILVSFAEKKILLEFVRKVVEMKSQPAKLWTDLQHYLRFVYRYCMTSDPDSEQEILSPYFIADMRSIVCSLMEEDQIQLCLRLFSLLREYTVFAHKQHQKNTDLETAIESLFYYYEAFLSATKNICKIFPELEKLLINTYKLGLLDFNTSIFMYYFYETPYVQDIVRDFEQIKDNVSIKAAGIYTVLTELHKLWRSQMLGINSVIAMKLGAKFKGLSNKTMTSHKRILSKNFWIDRSSEERSLQDVRLFDCQLFTLVGNRNIIIPEPTLDDSGQCVCEDCLIVKYNSILENSHNKMSSHCMKVSCRFCRQQVDLDHFQQHINAELDGNNCKNLSKIISDNIDIVKLGMTANAKHSRRNGSNHDFIANPKRHQNTNGSFIKDPSPKLASEPPILKSEDEDDDDDIIDVTKIPELEVTKMSRKTFYNFLKYRNSLVKDKDKKSEPVKAIETPPAALPVQNVAKQPPPKVEESPKVEVSKSSKATNTSSKNTGVTFPCGHSCKLEEELKSEFKKAYQDTCDHHKESKKCDCTFCEVFGTTTPHVHKSNETRNRLRIRLNQRNENGNCKIRTKVSLSSTAKTIGNKIDSLPVVNAKFNSNGLTLPPKQDEGNDKPLINDIHGLLNYIEGNTNVDKLAVAEKKAAKKARQRNKKEQERIKLEEEEKKRIAEEKRKLDEKIRNEELARQLAEKAAKKEQKKENRRKKQKNKEKTPNNSELMEETIPAMVTIKRLVQSNDAVPTVTITLKGSTADQDKLLYTLVNQRTGGNDAQSTENKKNKKNKDTGTNGQSGTTVNLEVKSLNKKNKNKNDKSNHQNNVIAKEVRLTLAVDPTSNGNVSDVKKNKVTTNNKQSDKTNNNKSKTEAKNKTNTNIIKAINKEGDINIPMLKLPPGITITKVDGPITDRNYKATNIENHSYNSNIPVSKSGVIVVDTEKLIKQSSTVTAPEAAASSKKNRRKRDKKKREMQNETQPSLPPTPNSKPSMVTLKNPLFRNIHNNHREPEIIPDIGQLQQAAIFKNENGMVTIRSSRLQQSLNNGTPISNLMPDLKPTLGPEVPSTYMSSCNFSELSTISPFNAQEILSGLPGIEITKVDKNSTRNEVDNKKTCHTAEVSIIPTSNSDKFNFDKDDLHYDSVFTPKDILEDDMDADERELEAFKRFCQQSVPPKRKEKVAHLNVKDIVLKKKNEKVSA